MMKDCQYLLVEDETMNDITIKTLEQRPSEHIVYDLISMLAGRDFEEPNLVDVISATCGWHPLEVDGEMTVQFYGKEYVIKRTK